MSAVAIPSDNASLIATARAAIDKLRHRAVLKDEVVDRWLSVMVKQEPDRLLWHIRRLDGNNASSMYGFVADYRGVHDGFNTARHLDLQRQMIATPEVQNDDMRRGSMFERVVQLMSHEVFHVRTDEAAMQAITAQRGTAYCPSLLGNPDDVVVHGGDQKLWDYKCPAALKEMFSTMIQEYVAQCHTYVMLGHAARMPIRRMELINLNAPPELTNDLALDLEVASKEGPEVFEKMSQQVAEWFLKMMSFKRDAKRPGAICLVRQPIAFDIEMARDISAAANAADQRALKGELAPWPQRTEVKLTDEEKAEASRLQVKAATAIAIAKEAEALVTKCNDDVIALLRGKDIKGKKAPMPMLTVTQRQNLNVDRAFEYLVSNGINADDLTERDGFDEEQIEKLAMGAGVDLDTLRRFKPNAKAVKKVLNDFDEAAVPGLSNISYSVSLTRSSKGEGAEEVSKLRDQMAGAMSALLDESDCSISKTNVDAGDEAMPTAPSPGP